MSFELPASMREALKATRAGNPVEATRLIQQALSGNAQPTAQEDAPRATASKIDRTAETLKPTEATGPLSKMRSFFRPQSAAPAPPLPEGAQWLLRSHTDANATRAFRLYVPTKTPRGLIVMLHGCTQNPEDFARGTDMNAVAEQHDLLVAWPEQSKSANAHACWNWFDPSHQQRDAGEPAILAGIVRALADEFDLPERRVMVAGLSAGGAMSAVMAQAYPELIGAVGVHSGLPSGIASNVGSAFAAMSGPSGVTARGTSDVPTFIIHGSADSTVHPGNAGSMEQSIGWSEFTLREDAIQAGGRSTVKTSAFAPDGSLRHESWTIDGAGHAWSGGKPGGSFTDPMGPDASAEMVRFFGTVCGEGE